ncbi:MAG: UDP-N-acetylmuramate dehydrogenase [Porticoccus sp.]
MLKIEQQVSLLHKNTLALPSFAENFCRVSTESELCEVLAWSRQHRSPVTILGGGSNVVLARDLGGLVVQMGISGIELISEEQDQRVVRVGAGENWHQLVLSTIEQGWFGLENLSLIPGLAGAAPIQNIGAYGVELSQRFLSLEAIHLETGEQVVMDASECQFGYRDSVFKHSGRDQYAITAITLALSSRKNLCLDYPALQKALDGIDESELTPKRVSDAVCGVRRTKLPSPEDIPNVGSFFKNPVISKEQAERLRQQYPQLVSYHQVDGREKLAAGWLVEQAGWKGFKQHGVGVHHQQSLVLVNSGGTGADLLSLASDIQASVADKFGISLEIEPRVYS